MTLNLTYRESDSAPIPDITSVKGEELTYADMDGNLRSIKTSVDLLQASLTFIDTGLGDDPGKTFDGNTTLISYNTIGSPSITGTNATGDWDINILGVAGSVDWSNVLNKPANLGAWIDPETGQLIASGSVVNFQNISGQIIGSQIANAELTVAKFAAGIEPVTSVTSIPTTKSTNTIYNTTDGKLYRWDPIEGKYVSSVPAIDITGQLVEGQIAPGSISVTSLKEGLTLISVVAATPAVFDGEIIFNQTEQLLYKWNGTHYVKLINAADIDGVLQAAQIASLAASQITGALRDDQISAISAAKISGEIVNSQIAQATIEASKFASGIEPVGVVDTLPNPVGYSGPLTVLLTTDSKLYRFTGTSWTKEVTAGDIDARGLNILDENGVPVFSSTGEVSSAAYVNLNGNNVLISDVAANSLVPSINYVGEFTTPPTSIELGSLYKQNAVYKNTLDGQSYVLTGDPLDWVVYLVDGKSFILTIESTNGTVFRVGHNTSTTLKARLFKNGAEVTDQTPTGWFRWRRVSAIPQDPPNDDATWNSLYATGYSQVSINVDDVYARATFFCDIISPN